ncbi:ADQ_G0032080.mRNA.1.CDS.1 [Saccharomyces cerevisiae]|nr:ADQ_G0032080.mRNA.1.CDS.1 [Saccharomyces cerevisiae]CAI5289774.1 CMF_HP2_G0029350.mRNA.1.CDS.1 [Saccharomyces cerevisiae]CAI6587162.1 CMF_HP2_G0029350.mRNA.1.CDS.1 [Saccharomyces cerevisiae]CAI6614161.1 CMF_HP1_G0032290.mRNA.1.CDS.1 [Saccharomyces cerevisiae]CAI6763525.1 ADQ_G0032080.mRNA.1.CDS.1 [Saccharomyces cerevisiae]
MLPFVIQDAVAPFHRNYLLDEKGKVKYIPVNELRRLSTPSSYGTLFLSIESFLLVIFNAGCTSIF